MAGLLRDMVWNPSRLVLCFWSLCLKEHNENERVRVD